MLSSIIATFREFADFLIWGTVKICYIWGILVKRGAHCSLRCSDSPGWVPCAELLHGPCSLLVSTLRPISKKNQLQQIQLLTKSERCCDAFPSVLQHRNPTNTQSKHWQSIATPQFVRVQSFPSTACIWERILSRVWVLAAIITWSVCSFCRL